MPTAGACPCTDSIIMGLVRIMSLYPKYNGSHFGLPPSSIQKMIGLVGSLVWTRTYSHEPHRWDAYVSIILCIQRSWYPIHACACPIYHTSKKAKKSEGQSPEKNEDMQKERQLYWLIDKILFRKASLELHFWHCDAFSNRAVRRVKSWQ